MEAGFLLRIQIERLIWDQVLERTERGSTYRHTRDTLAVALVVAFPNTHFILHEPFGGGPADHQLILKSTGRTHKRQDKSWRGVIYLIYSQISESCRKSSQLVAILECTGREESYICPLRFEERIMSLADLA